MKTKYVVGFLFSKDRQWVALIRKAKPEWQKGFCNGIGGKIEGEETPIHAMQREFNEEAGLIIKNWNQFATMKGDDWEVHCFVSFNERVHLCTTKTDEDVFVTLVSNIDHEKPLLNIKWLIEMALSNDFKNAVIEY